MLSFYQKVVLPYAQKDLYHLVCDVNAYPNFLPWCQGLRVVENNPTSLVADVHVGTNLLHETFRSQVFFYPVEEIVIQGNPDGNTTLKKLESRWQFYPLGPGLTQLTFDVHLDMQSGLMEKALKAIWPLAQEQMVQAFIKRAQDQLSS